MQKFLWLGLVVLLLGVGCGSRQVTIEVQGMDGGASVPPGERATEHSFKRPSRGENRAVGVQCPDNEGLYRVSVRWDGGDVVVNAWCAAPTPIVGDDQHLDFDTSDDESTVQTPETE